MASSLAARQTLNLARLTASRSSASTVQRRCFSAAADHHGPPKVDCWKAPMSPSTWKEEHFVLVSLSGWGLLIYGGFKAFSGGKKEEKLVEAAN
ncbi:uncharacterized protein LOC141698506 [Apium graveolens]|uniref:uncharacterized protein LOC141698506 n=1 Tax=Apium graveolens TaxID=4045 RepID=UPI003D7AC879